MTTSVKVLQAPSHRRAAPLFDSDRGQWVLAAVATLLTFPVGVTAPGYGIEASWNVALILAARNGLEHGVDVLFPYGPLGLFFIPPASWYTASALVAMAVGLVVHIGFVRAVLLHLRPAVSNRLLLVVLLLLAAHMSNLIPSPELLTVSVLLVALWAAPRAQSLSRSASVRLIALGVLVAGVLLLGRFNEGVTCFGILFLTLLSGPRKKWPALIAATFVASTAWVIALWVASGQPLANLPLWFMGTLELGSGYPAAMGYEEPGRRIEYLKAVILLALLAAAAWPARAIPAAPVVALIVAWVGYLVSRHAFVRHDAHSSGFFFLVAVLAVALLAVASRRRLATGTAALATYWLAVSIGQVLPPPLVNEARQAPALAVNSLLTALDPDRNGLQSASRAAAEQALGLPQDLDSALSNRTVHVDPWDTSVIWLRDLEWAPLPVFQQYSAYTSELDAKNAAALTEVGRPEAILTHTSAQSIDGRARLFETPRYHLAALCNYQVTRRSPPWEVLTPIQNRCGDARELVSVFAREGEDVSVPEAAPSHAVFARIDLSVPLHHRLWGAFFKPLFQPSIVTEGGPSGRLLPGTSDGPLLLRIPADLHAPFVTQVDVTSFQLHDIPDGARISFFAVPVD